MNQKRLSISTTTDGKPPRTGYETSGAPAPLNATTGQHEAYWVLNEEERAKGFVRPVRCNYKHVGVRPVYPTRPLTEEEEERYRNFGYACFEEYPSEQNPHIGRYWTTQQLNSGCGTVTTMGRAIAETYARDPKYYGATFCCGCGTHLPVGQHGEFVWMDSKGNETNEKVGT